MCYSLAIDNALEHDMSRKIEDQMITAIRAGKTEWINAL